MIDDDGDAAQGEIGQINGAFWKSILILCR